MEGFLIPGLFGVGQTVFVQSQSSGMLIRENGCDRVGRFVKRVNNKMPCPLLDEFYGKNSSRCNSKRLI